MRREISKEGKKALELIKEKLYSYSESISDEYDIMELIEDNIREIFECDLDCASCSREEQGECMQTFKKANLYFLRKLYLDEVKLMEFTNNILEMIELVAETKKILNEEKESMQDESNEKYKKRFSEAKKKHVHRKGNSFYI